MLSPDITPLTQDVAGVIFVRYHENKPQILLSRYVDTNNKKYVITVPGGKIELGEKPEEAAIRESSEETNLQVIDSDLLIPTGEISLNDSQTMILFFAFIDEACLEPHEPENALPAKHVGWEWVKLGELIELEVAEYFPTISHLPWFKEVMDPIYVN